MTLPANLPATGRQLTTLIAEDGTLTLRLREVPVPEPKAGQVLVRVEAAPINPSDLGVMFAAADPQTIGFSGTAPEPVVSATVPEAALVTLAARIGKPLPAGNEGAGEVVAVGAGVDESWIGRTVALLGGATYADYRCVPQDSCLLLNEGTTAAEGASCFVNPLTALGMVETMKQEGHGALAHTAAASNLGQMLNRICIADGVPLVNIVRKAEQVALLEGQGAAHVVNSSEPEFSAALTDAFEAAGVTLAFDATGGGRLASQLLTAMERALVRQMTEFAGYGSPTYKQVYIYGGLDRGPTELNRSYGMAWGIGGWLLTPFLLRIGPAAVNALKQRVADEITTTFASSYAKEVSLTEALSEAAVMDYVRQATSSKTLICPQR
ncbi:MAG: zinc-binding dehydrogenase [Pseudomonadota bacterium]